MDFPLPPPDPHENLAGAPPLLKLAAPTMCFPLGPPDEEAERLAAALLDHRPGALFVFAARR
jgi:hypothetical protein